VALVPVEWALSLLAAEFSFRKVEHPARTWLYERIGAAPAVR
jgi:hypothetical protein